MKLIVNLTMDDYQLAFTGIQETDYSTLGGGVGLGSPGDCSPFNPMGFNNPDNQAAKDYLPPIPMRELN